jgi:hypothetical protein
LPGAGAAEVNEAMRFSRIEEGRDSLTQNYYGARIANVNPFFDNSAMLVLFNTHIIKVNAIHPY